MDPALDFLSYSKVSHFSQITPTMNETEPELWTEDSSNNGSQSSSEMADQHHWETNTFIMYQQKSGSCSESSPESSDDKTDLEASCGNTDSVGSEEGANFYSSVDLNNMPTTLTNMEHELFLPGGDCQELLGQADSNDADMPSNIELSPSKDSKHSMLRYPPCAVCSGKSSGMHYGCYTCEACKNFFRRYLLRSDGFQCKKNNKCEVLNRSRGNCSGCRLKKCLEVGMAKEKSKIGRYTHAQRTETIRKVKKLEGKEDIIDKIEDMANELTVVKSEPTNEHKDIAGNKLSEEEKDLVNTLVESMDAIQHFGERGSTPEGRTEIIKEHYQKYLAKVELFGPLRAIPKEEYFTLLKLHNIDLDGRWTLFKQEANNCSHIVQRYCQFAYKIPGFIELSMKDQESLLKVGHCDFFTILLHEGYDQERKIFLEMNGVPSHVEEAADKIFSREIVELQTEISTRWQSVNLLKEEKALLLAMALLCSDRIDYENVQSIEALHDRITNILIKVMESEFGKDSQKRFAKFIDILTFSREASYAYYKEYQQMSSDEMVTMAAPEFPTLCPDDFGEASQFPYAMSLSSDEQSNESANSNTLYPATPLFGNHVSTANVSMPKSSVLVSDDSTSVSGNSALNVTRRNNNPLATNGNMSISGGSSSNSAMPVDVRSPPSVISISSESEDGSTCPVPDERGSRRYDTVNATNKSGEVTEGGAANKACNKTNVGSKEDINQLSKPDGGNRHYIVINADSQIASSISRDSTCYLLPQSAMSSESLPVGGHVIPLYLVINNHSTAAVASGAVPHMQQDVQHSQGRLTNLPNMATGPAQTFPQGSIEPSKRNDTVTASTTDSSMEKLVSDTSNKSQTKPKQKQSARKFDVLKFPPCEVCGGETSGIHFGCYTCEACKIFFRRCLKRLAGDNSAQNCGGQGQSPKQLVCGQNGNCEVSFRNNKMNCSACRYNKCAALGMSVDRCKKGRLTYTQRTETIKKVRILEGKDVEPMPGISGECSVRAGDTATEAAPTKDVYGALITKGIRTVKGRAEHREVSRDIIDDLVSSMRNIRPWGDELEDDTTREERIKEHYDRYMIKVGVFGSMGGVSQEEYMNLLQNYGIDLDGGWTEFAKYAGEWEHIVARYCKFAKQIPNFTRLCVDDQIKLLRHTHCDFFVILMHRGYREEYNIFLELNGIIYHVEEASDRLFSREVIQGMVVMMSKLQKLNVTNEEMAVLVALSTMSTDQCQLENPQLVEETQLQLADLLLSGMRAQHGTIEGSKRFTKFVDFLTKMREFSEVYYKEYKTFCEHDIVKQNLPDMTVLCPDDG
ncbi:uncharacterized protein LOC128237642 [Mya arenaria]|uniref:uncharacterized protein LOC128237642 n=1 Tax=Mya arenaria TaxID=6604 RepID=UPI0022E6FB47|nr:uncharacterized protein LOC128237642 [Mya arenaria]